MSHVCIQFDYIYHMQRIKLCGLIIRHRGKLLQSWHMDLFWTLIWNRLTVDGIRNSGSRKLPLKIKCFTWIYLNNKVNTWDNLLKKGWIGPNLFHLCFADAESTEHLFIECSFGKEVRMVVTNYFGVSFPWEEYTLKETHTLDEAWDETFVSSYFLLLAYSESQEYCYFL